MCFSMLERVRKCVSVCECVILSLSVSVSRLVCVYLFECVDLSKCVFECAELLLWACMLPCVYEECIRKCENMSACSY